MPEIALPVPEVLRRSTHRSEWDAIESGAQLLELVCERAELADLSETEVLDLGCGNRFSQAILQYGIPVKRYVGVDVFEELIDYLLRENRDPRFEYYHVDFQNTLYNPEGRTLDTQSALPLGGRRFDLVCMMSLLTHVVPAHFEALLALAQRHLAREGTLVFTAFVGEHQVVDFRDAVPGKPLLWASYRESVVRRMVEQAGLRVERMYPKSKLAQATFVCRAVAEDGAR